MSDGQENEKSLAVFLQIRSSRVSCSFGAGTAYSIVQPCEKYLSWEDGEKYVLDHKAVHKAAYNI